MRFEDKGTEVLEGDLTPMIDMTFQLIAFFMLLINFSEVERSEDIVLPYSVMAIPPHGAPADYKMVLNLLPDGNVLFAGSMTPIDSMGVIFTQEINNAKRVGVTQPREIPVIIRAHEDTPTGLVQKLIANARDQELEKFSLRVNEKIR